MSMLRTGLTWSMDYNDTDVKGYTLSILYFAEENVCYISLVRDGAEIRFNYYPATNEYEYDPQSIDAFRSELNEAFSTEGDDFLKMPMTIFSDNINGFFGMTFEELYALSAK